MYWICFPKLRDIICDFSLQQEFSPILSGIFRNFLQHMFTSSYVHVCVNALTGKNTDKT